MRQGPSSRGQRWESTPPRPEAGAASGRPRMEGPCWEEGIGHGRLTPPEGAVRGSGRGVSEWALRQGWGSQHASTQAGWAGSQGPGGDVRWFWGLCVPLQPCPARPPRAQLRLRPFPLQRAAGAPTRPHPRPRGTGRQPLSQDRSSPRAQAGLSPESWGQAHRHHSPAYPPDALGPAGAGRVAVAAHGDRPPQGLSRVLAQGTATHREGNGTWATVLPGPPLLPTWPWAPQDRKSTRLNSSH